MARHKDTENSMNHVGVRKMVIKQYNTYSQKQKTRQNEEAVLERLH